MDNLQERKESSYYNHEVVKAEEKFHEEKANKESLIRETFLVWYILTEGIVCDNFPENSLLKILRRNFTLLKEIHINDSDVNFLLGWMLSISFWYFDNDLDESEGSRLLYKAYKLDSTNLLFKWAVRNHLKVSPKEEEELKEEIRRGFMIYYKHGSFIEQYFLDLLKT